MVRPLTIKFIRENDDGDEIEDELPTKYGVCPRCDGAGSHVNPNVDGHGITAEEWERDWDDESREGYFRGDYDVSCEECHGLRVVPCVDREACDQKLLEEYDEHQRIEARWRAEEAHARRMGY